MTREKIKLIGDRVEFKAGEWTHNQPIEDFLAIHFDVEEISANSKTCGSCKHYDIHNEICINKEVLSNMFGDDFENEFVPDMNKFYCSEWESKND